MRAARGARASAFRARATAEELQRVTALCAEAIERSASLEAAAAGAAAASVPSTVASAVLTQENAAAAVHIQRLMDSQRAWVRVPLWLPARGACAMAVSPSRVQASAVLAERASLSAELHDVKVGSCRRRLLACLPACLTFAVRVSR